jgi:hypothetical protein
MPGVVPGIHVFKAFKKEDVDGRDEPGHDGLYLVSYASTFPSVKAASGMTHR